MKRSGLLLFITLLGLAALAPAQELSPYEVTMKSPDENVALTFRLNKEGEPSYAVSYKGKPVILDSRLGLELKEAPLLKGFRIADNQTGIHDETWKPVAAERSPIRDHYHWMTWNLAGAQGHKLNLEFRVYDEGAAFRYSIPQQSGLSSFTLTGEASEFHFTGNHACWPVYTAQAIYKSGLRLSDVKKGCERPLTVEIENGPAAAIGEAGMLDYSRMKFQPAGQPDTLKASLEGEVTGAAPFATPWRFVMFGDTPGQLLERNYLVPNLNAPSQVKDTSWIKPGKVIREVTLSTAGGKAAIDFAAQMGLQYIEYDAGWYGPERDRKSDARHVALPPSHAPLDLQEVARYGSEKGIGVILYVNQIALERQADEIFPLYHQWGIKGVKYGFVNVGPQKWAKWIADNLRKCAENQLMVDIHDEYRNTGISRTFPNLMTTEGVGGDEEWPPASHFTALPFTRALCGTYDNTICMFSDRLTRGLKNRRGDSMDKSRAYQLAKAVVVFSPWQFLYWYDRPSAYKGEPELEFWKTIPTVWDETRVVNGAIGKYATIARRRGGAWYVGSVNAGEPRKLQIPLSFLEPGKKYAAWIGSEGDPAATTGEALNKVKIEEQAVDASTVITAEMGAAGGHVMRITPVK